MFSVIYFMKPVYFLFNSTDRYNYTAFNFNFYGEEPDGLISMKVDMLFEILIDYDPGKPCHSLPVYIHVVGRSWESHFKQYMLRFYFLFGNFQKAMIAYFRK